MSEFGAIIVKGKLRNTTSASSNLDIKLRITEYLKVHGCVDEDEIAKALDSDVIDVLDALYELQETGVVICIADESSSDSNGG
jgi:transcription initiation factor IIE alpha subunit